MDCEEEEVAAGSFSELYVDGGMKIFVLAVGNHEIMTFKVDGSDKVLDVMVKIEEAIGIPIHQIWLLFDGLLMGEEKTLAECGVHDRSLLHCIQALRGGGDGGMEILVRAAKIGEISMTYKVDDSDKVLDVMVKIAEAISIPIHQIRLIFHDLVMGEEKTLAECGVQDGSYLFWDQALCGGGDGGMEIFVRAITISEIGMTFKVDGSDKVWDVMVKIEEAIGIPIHQISLLFDGRKMGEETTLAEWGVEDGSLLDCFRELRGGGGCKPSGKIGGVGSRTHWELYLYSSHPTLLQGRVRALRARIAVRAWRPSSSDFPFALETPMYISVDDV
ncbi:polyubiquitin-like isoform X2 [Ananas comosus]|uniref:Polyubiquitin-like isoform X2 n=1 Tax=Ananas comosus TaxID=4615 RepID=A0A6P5GCQ5_ANACO|nr:polyubiquitin-like isoform X2 [Ananas comosus]